MGQLDFCYSLRESFQDAPWTIALPLLPVAPRRLSSGPDAPMRTRQVLAFLSVCTLVVLSFVWWGARRAASPVEELVSVLGERRFIEPRLTGGFAHAPCTTVIGPAYLIPRVHCSKAPKYGSSEWRELASAIRVFTREGGGKEAQDLHQRAVSGLVWPQGERFIARSVAVLEKAVRLAPDDARLRSDLAAGLYVLAQERDDPALLVRALAEIGEAVRLDPKLPEAHFNLALIRERLFLRDGARKAWAGLLRSNEESEWAEEAQEHLDTLSAPTTSELWTSRLPELREAARQGGADTIRKLIAPSLQTAREYAMEELLGNWGDLVLQHRLVEASESLRLARMIGEALYAETGEPSVSDAVAAIDHAGIRSEMLDLAVGHRAYRDGQQAVRQQLPVEAASSLNEAHESLTLGKSPLAPWALLLLAGVDVSASHYEAAVKKYEGVAAAARESKSQSLAGRAAWGLGHVLLRQGRLSESLAHFLTSISFLEAAREGQNLGAVLELVAENLRFLGQRSTAWKYRYRAARSLMPYRDSIRLHNMLWEGGWAMVEEGKPLGGRDFLDECVGLAQESGLPQRLVEALLWRGKIHLASGDLSIAQGDLRRAQEINRGTSDARIRQRLAADLDYVEGEVRRRIQPATALEPLSRAITFYEQRELYLDLPGAYLARYQASKDSGRVSEAEGDLETALQVLEERIDTIKNHGLQLSVKESAQPLYDEMLLLKAKQGDEIGAFVVSERSRSLVGADELERFGQIASTIPENLAVLEYARVNSYLFIWLLYGGQIESFVREIPPGQLEEIVSRFVATISKRAPIAEIDRQAQSLYRLLLPAPVSSLPREIDLVVVPDKCLNAVPFTALKNPSSGSYLIEERTVQVALSAALRGKREERGRIQSSAVLVGATEFDLGLTNLRPLPGAEREVRNLARLYVEAQVLLGAEATRSRVMGELSKHGVFHFAGHAVFNSNSPERSYFVLAPAGGQLSDAGMLFLDEVAKSQLEGLHLVVLSACRTLGPLESRTGGVSGMAQPFLKAGVDSVVGSLWDVDDPSAEHFMTVFHRSYRQNQDAAKSLRQAQLDSLLGGNESLNHPGNWAAFQLVQS